MAELCGPWPVDPACPFGIPVDPEDRSPEQVAAVLLASEILWRATAGRYGPCAVTVRPCVAQPNRWDWPPLPAGVSASAGGPWWMSVGCGCRSRCGCTSVTAVTLPGPVASVTSVKVDGVTLTSPAQYRLDGGGILQRTDGQGWPLRQNMAAPDTEPGTWSVTYARGRAVPLGGQRAVAELAAELLKACTNSGACRLPRRVQTITRQDITMTLLDPQEFLDKGRTGIGSIDLWLAQVNPAGRRSPSAVYSPDVDTFRVLR